MKRRWLAGLVSLLLLVPLLALLWFAAMFRPKWEREDPAAVRREIASLTVKRDSLRKLVYDAAETSDLLDEQPPGDVVIGVPTPFVDAMVQSVVIGWFHDVDLRLPRMRVRKSGEVKARLGIFGRRTVGAYKLLVTLDDVRGQLQPGPPVLGFGGDTITLEIPVRVAGGTGNAHIVAEWDAKGIAGPVCGDMTTSGDVTGQVRARTYVARGRIVLSAVDGAVMADPDFPDLAIRLFIDPSPASVAALDSVLATRGGVCGYAIEKSRASERIQELVGRGFRVKIPQRFFRPIRMPVAVQTSVPVQNREVALEVKPSGLAVTKSTVWFGADVSTVKAPAARTP